MDSLTVSHTYGRALFEAARDLGKVKEILVEYKAVSEIFAGEPLLRKLFLVPTISVIEKRDAAKKIFEGRIAPELLNFIYVLIGKRRISAWESIGRHFEELVLEADGLTKGILYSVVPVDADRLKSLEESASASLGKKVRLENRIDRSLIGGMTMYVDGKRIDASVKTRLEAMKQRMKI